MIAQRYKDMLSGKSVIRQISEWSTARGTEVGYENVFDYSLGNPSVPCPEHFTKTCIDLLQTKEPVTLHGYSPTLTIPAVRKAVAESLNRRFGMTTVWSISLWQRVLPVRWPTPCAAWRCRGRILSPLRRSSRNTSRMWRAQV